MKGRGRGSTLHAAGEPMVWLTGGALALCALMIAGLLALVLWQGLSTFWPVPVERLTTHDGRVYMGEITRVERYRVEPADLEALPAGARATVEARLAENEGLSTRRLVRTGNYRLTQNHFQWVGDPQVAAAHRPDWAVVMERLEWGRFYGFPLRLEVAPPAGAPDGSPAEVFQGREEAWAAFRRLHGPVLDRLARRRALEKDDTGHVNARLEAARLEARQAEMDGDPARQQEAARREAEVQAWATAEFDRIRAEINVLRAENARYRLLMETAGEGTLPPQEEWIPLEQVVRAYPANSVGLAAKAGLYLSRWWEFLTADPREANSEGGVFPAIFGTVVMTLLMSLAVVPFGVMAALYLREYARGGLAVSTVRIAVNNLAGVPSIVFGVFGLGFFCYLVGASLDDLLFAATLPNPTYGKGGVLWASLTLALLTLPVVIVATEEALAAVPSSMREGSYACGASKWQTIRRIVLPRAMPGITTGLILAIARGAGEVAPLMLVGAVKLAPMLPVDGIFPYIHPERSFMHLGFHIYDVGFQSQNSEAAKPMVFTTTLLLITLVAVLNMAAVWLRSRLRRRFVAGQF